MCERERGRGRRWSREEIEKLAAFQSKVSDNRTFDAEREYLCQRTSISKDIVLCLGLALG